VIDVDVDVSVAADADADAEVMCDADAAADCRDSVIVIVAQVCPAAHAPPAMRWTMLSHDQPLDCLTHDADAFAAAALLPVL
jgi:hypothetical protein